MKKLLLALALLLVPSAASAQCTGIFQPNTLCGNLGAIPIPPKQFSASGTVVGPGSSIVNELAIWANTTGTQLGDATGISAPAGGPLTINPTANSFNQGLVINQSSATNGTIAGPTARCVQNFEPTFVYNNICVNDSSNITGVGTTFTNAFQVGLVTGGTNSQGTKAAIYASLIHISASAIASQNRDNIAIGSLALAAASEGGTNTGAGALGTLFATAFQAQLANGGTNFFAISGGETDVGILTGGSAKYRLGWSVIDNGNIQAASLDAAFDVGTGGGSPGFKTAFLLDSFHGAAPLSTSGCVICTDGSSVTITTGIDLSAYTISGYFLRSSSFAIDGSGNGSALTLALNGASIGSNALAVTGASLFTGAINLGVNAASVVCPSIYFASNIRLACGGTSGYEWLNNANNAVRMSLSDAGALLVASTVSSVGGFIANSNTGLTQTCTVNQAKTLVFTLGILTGGSCNT